jgi:hypothetical protein
MKRDMDILRDLLLKIEEAPGKVSWKAIVDGTDEEQKNKLQHLKLAAEAGLINGVILNTMQHWIIENIELTWEGHDFIDSIRDSEVWKKTKNGAAAAGGFTVGLLKDLAKGLIKKQIEEHTGVKL